MKMKVGQKYFAAVAQLAVLPGVVAIRGDANESSDAK